VNDAPQHPCPLPPAGPLGAPADKAARVPVPLGRPFASSKAQRGLFEGDAAAIELRSRLAQTRDGALPAPRAAAGVPAFRALRSAGALLTAAAVAGAAGYLAAGIRLSSKPAHVALFDMIDGLPATLTLTAHLDALAPAAAAHRPGPPVAAAALPPPPPMDASETAARLKLGAGLMAAGDVAAARMMFTRVAEAGDAAGALALAETYDPAVLGATRLRGWITPDAAEARRWYEKARDMGSGAAPARIARLTR